MFDIQLFADTVTSSSEGNLIVKFYDGDDRTFKIDNPGNITNAQIKSFVEYLKEKQPIIGDKTGASLVGAESFEIVETQRTKLDVSLS